MLTRYLYSASLLGMESNSFIKSGYRTNGINTLVQRLQSFNAHYVPFEHERTPNSDGKGFLYEKVRIVGHFANYANGEYFAGIEVKLADGAYRRFRWDNLVSLTSA